MGWCIVNDIKDYFHTDWGAMTQHDWLGLIMTIAVFLVMLGLYLYVFHPSNKARFEAQRYIPLDDEPALHVRPAAPTSDNTATEEQK